MINEILSELKRHAPFTLFGVVAGIGIIFLLRELPADFSYTVFYVLHPIHVMLSAIVTASMYELHKSGAMGGKPSLWILLLIGYTGSIGIATLSDSLVPYLGEIILDMPNRQAHLGFIEEWWLINPAAILGVAIAYYKPSTKFPHAGHVLLSTGASLFHILMAGVSTLDLFACVTVFFFLFISVWIPCCLSDIVFPLLFVRKPSP